MVIVSPEEEEEEADGGIDLRPNEEGLLELGGRTGGGCGVSCQI